jgi:hypothetical protein
LIRSGRFSLPGKKALRQGDSILEVVVVDVTESPVERQKKKTTTSVFGQKKVSHLEVTISGQSKDGSNYLQSFVVKAEGMTNDYSRPVKTG